MQKNPFFYISINFIYWFFSQLIIFEIILRSKFYPNTKLLYSGWLRGFGFGDHIAFCVNIKEKIKINERLFCYSNQQFENALFFFDKKLIIKSFFAIPKFLNESHLGNKYLYNNNFFKPKKLKSPHNNKIELNLCYGTKPQIEFIKSRLKKFTISTKLKNILNKKTIVIGIKNFSLKKKINNNVNFQKRQTRDLKKIFKLLKKISSANINIILLGKASEHFIKIFINKKIPVKNIYLFKDLSKNYSISDQVYLAQNAYGYFGNGYGAMVFFDILVKKILLIDYVWVDVNNLYKKNRLHLYKKIINKKNKRIEICDLVKSYNNKDHKILENTYEQIYKNFKIKFKV
jgi:hypothetical protein